MQARLLRRRERVGGKGKRGAIEAQVEGGGFLVEKFRVVVRDEFEGSVTCRGGGDFVEVAVPRGRGVSEG